MNNISQLILYKESGARTQADSEKELSKTLFFFNFSNFSFIVKYSIF